MKFTILRNPQEKNKACVIPPPATKLAEFHDQHSLSAYIDPGSIVLLGDDMNARQMVSAIRTLSELSTDYTVKLALACGVCVDCGQCGEEIPESCAECQGCGGVEIPSCVLEEAGIPDGASLQTHTVEGKVIVTAMEDDEDTLLSTLPETLMDTLLACDICIPNLVSLLKSGEIIHE